MLFVRLKALNKIVYSLSMKFRYQILFLSLTWLLFACPPAKIDRDLTKIQENNMDLPDLRERYYKGLKFKLSDLFTNDYNNEYVIQDDALTMAIYDIDVNFSIEEFSMDEAELIQYGFEEETDLISAVHDNYVFKRLETLDGGISSIKKTSSKCKYPCLVQVMHGNSSFYGEPSTYMMATIEANKKFYVLHLIGIEENMGYLFDDFENILSSVTL